jgi:TolB protein
MASTIIDRPGETRTERTFAMRLLTILLAGFAMMLGAVSPAHAQLKVDVVGERYIPLRIAIPDFDATGPGASEAAAQMMQVIRQDLQGSAVFQVMDKAAFIERDLDISLTPRFPDWTVIDAQALVVGNVVVDANNNMTVQFRLYDVFRGAQQFATQYTVPTPLNWRRLAHKVADDIYSQLTGDPAYFDSRVVFVAQSNYTDADGRPALRKRLAIMDQDGANAEFLLSGMNLVSKPRFSPSTQTIIFTAWVPNPRNPKETLLRTYLYDIETGRQELLSEARNAMDFSARFSPDGRSVAMTREVNGNSDIYIVELARRSDRRLTTWSGIETAPSFSADGKYIVFQSDRSGSSQIYTMRADGGQMPCPTGGADTACRITFGEGRYDEPVWSPRGDWIAFTRQYGGRWSIGIIRPDGTGEKMLTDSFQDEGPTWAPNGRVIAFAREAGRGAGPKLWTIDITGLNERRMPTPGDATHPAWSPILK